MVAAVEKRWWLALEDGGRGASGDSGWWQTVVYNVASIAGGGSRQWQQMVVNGASGGKRWWLVTIDGGRWGKQ